MRPKQLRFVEEYLLDLNATQAAIRAGYSPKTARQMGQENLSKPDIKAEMERRIHERAARTRLTQDAVVRELAKIAFSNIVDYLEWGSEGIRPLASNELNEDATAAVAELRETRTRHGVGLHVKLWDKLRALEMLGRHLGLFQPLAPLEAMLASMPQPLADGLRRAIALQLRSVPTDPKQKVQLRG